MLILGIDSSTPRLSLALGDGAEVMGVLESGPHPKQAEAILPELERLLDAHRLTPRQIQGIAVGLGPGTFTGLRAGIAAAQGLAQALGVPIAGVSSFYAAALASGADLALVVADARADQVYAALYRRGPGTLERLLPEQITSVAVLAAGLPRGEIAVTGPDADRFFPALHAAGNHDLRLIPAPACFPSAAAVIQTAASRLALGGEAPHDLIPLYLRRTQAEETLDKHPREAG